jgi:uncharacterized protein YPO0396
MSCIGENELAMKHVIKHIDMSINNNRYHTSSYNSAFDSMIKQIYILFRESHHFNFLNYELYDRHNVFW